MHTYPGVPWDEWPNMPYELLMDCISYMDGDAGDGEE